MTKNGINTFILYNSRSSLSSVNNQYRSSYWKKKVNIDVTQCRGKTCLLMNVPHFPDGAETEEDTTPFIVNMHHKVWIPFLQRRRSNVMRENWQKKKKIGTKMFSHFLMDFCLFLFRGVVTSFSLFLSQQWQQWDKRHFSSP